MCGIHGGLSLKEDGFKRALESMRHRGPDSEGIYVAPTCGKMLYLGMRRLAITGIANGDQPLFSSCGRVILTFNGEIYNYLELWDALAIEGTPRSDGDSIIAVYLKYGVTGLKLLRGMFALSLYDCSVDKIYLLRDWFGEKPLYLYRDTTQLIWSSTIKGIISNLGRDLSFNLKSLHNYFRFTYIPTADSIYNGICAIEPGVCLEFDMFGDLTAKINLRDEIINMSYYPSANVLSILPDKISGGLIGETGVGVLLSGGIDSGIVAGLSSKILERTSIRAFTIASSDLHYDESKDASEMADYIGIEHEIIDFHSEFDAKAFFEVIKDLDQPFADSSFIVSWTAFRYIKRNHPSVKVILTGDGGDEIWGGYNKHKILRVPMFLFRPIKLLVIIVLRLQLLRFWRRNILGHKFYKFLKAFTWKSKYMGILSLGFDRLNLSYLFTEFRDVFYEDAKDINEAIYLDQQYSLCYDLNVKTDLASMLNSIEARSPLLDIDMYVINRSNFQSKNVISQSLNYLFPKNYINKPKRGFSFNLAEFILVDFKEYALLYLDEKMLAGIPSINHKRARYFVSMFYNGNYYLSFEVYSLLIASIWFNARMKSGC